VKPTFAKPRGKSRLRHPGPGDLKIAPKSEIT
jgi:hypothetical protein